MKRIVDAKEFENAIIKAAKVADKKALLPAVAGIMVEFIHNKCVISTTNLSQWYSTSIQAKGDDCFGFIFTEAKPIVDACKFYKGDLVFNYDESKIQLSSAGKSLTKRTIPVEEFPEVPEIDALGSEHYSTTSEAILNRFNKVKYACATDTLRPIHTGILFKRNMMAAVDGFRLAVNTDDNLNISKDFVVPQDAILFTKGFSGNMTIDVCNRYVRFSDGTSSVLSRLLEGEFLNVDQFISNTPEETYIVNIKDYTDGLKYLIKLSGSVSRTAVMDKGRVYVITSDGKYDVSINIKGTAGIVYGFNPVYMMDALGQFNCDEVKIEISGSIKPIVVRGDDSNFALVLPVRIKDEDMAA